MSDNGEFWMPLAEFRRNFDDIDICHLQPHDVKVRAVLASHATQRAHQ